ncbi:MAG: hypothetical protein O8C61_10430 [Candidatus Methanoperedens sp.]|nr:hypothetical protein [Candidatus Methanoperedens sp.]
MNDLVLDTNALRLLLQNIYVDRILASKDEIFVCKKWRKESGGIKELQLGFNIFSESLKKLMKKNKFHEKSAGGTALPQSLKKALEEHGADEVDLDVASIAYNRSISGQVIFLVSDDHPFERAQPLFEKYNINFERRKVELNRMGL